MLRSRRSRRGAGNIKRFKRQMGDVILQGRSVAGVYSLSVWSDGAIGATVGPSTYQFGDVVGAPPAGQNVTQFAVDPLNSAIQHVGFCLGWQMRDVVNYTEFSNLFDSYKIDYITVTFRPQYMTNDGTNYAGTIPSIEFTTLDRDDTIVPNFGTWQQKMSKYVRQLNKPITIKVHPTVIEQQTIYQVGSSTNTATKATRPGWYDWNTQTVLHTGIKGYLKDLFVAQNSSQHMRVQTTVHFRCRSVQ